MMLRGNALICSFEEVHQNGATNYGFFLNDKTNIRYEYLNIPYVIFYNPDKMSLFNKEKMDYSSLDTNENYLKIFERIKNFENPKNIDEENLEIIFDIKEDFKGTNKIIIKSQEMNAVIYVLDCEVKETINKLFFNQKKYFVYGAKSN